MKYFFVLIGICVASFCQAATSVQSTDFIKQEIVNKLEQTFPANKRLTFSVGHIDSRLKLANCDIPLDVHLPQSQQGHRLLVSVQCRGVQPWKLHVPVTISQLQAVIIARQNLLTGTTLTDENVSVEERNITGVSQSYVSDLTEIKGMALKRSVKAGTIINKSMLKYPLYVKRGDMVQVVVQKGKFKVQTPAIAQKNGILYEDIPVKNMNSKKVVIVQVIGKGMVKVDV